MGIVALAASSFGAAGSASGDPGPHLLPGQYEHPPGVVVESRGHRLGAAMGSFCWSTWYDDHTGRGLCADTFRAPSTEEQLPVRGKRIVHIDVGIPSESLTASLDDQTLRGPRRGEPSGRYWALRLPRHVPPTSVLSLGARFAQGGVPYGVTLRRVKS